MMRFVFLLLVGCFVFSPAFKAEAKNRDLAPLTIDLAEDFVNITTGFDGAHLVLFGTRHGKGDLAVVIRGPEKTAVVRQKNKVFGVWMNTESFKFRDVPSYYDYGLSPVDGEKVGEKNAPLMKTHKVGIDPEFFEFKHPDAAGLSDFQAALLRTKQADGAYPRAAKVIHFLNDDLFRVEFYLPASVPKGEYTVTTYLMNNGRMVDQQKNILNVKQIGFSSTVNKVAYDYSFAYGCLCVLLALFSGWGINALRRGF